MSGADRPPPSSERVPLDDASQVGGARRTVAALARRLALDETESGRASILAAEAAANVLRHGGGGELLVRALSRHEGRGLELLALDAGPGIADVGRALADGHSTAGSSGTGLGAMRRLSTVFEVHSAPAQGTAVLMRLHAGPAASASARLGVVCVARPDEQECGDVWEFEPRPTGGRLLVADGLGHGPVAREAALLAVQGAARGGESPGRALEEAHRDARGGRGAAIAVADVDLAAREVRFAGFGNVSAVLVDGGQSRSLVSMNGTVGQGVLRVREFSYPFTPGALLLLFSDGLATHWSLDRYPGLVMRHPSLLAGVLYRDHWRRRDDVTVVALRLDEP